MERPQPGEREALGGEAAPAELTPEQRSAVARIVGAMDGGEGANLLLCGATGSGKTEVYLQACAAALERGLGAIVLVPEIALTPQALGRFRARFGENVALLHSGLSDAERRDERLRIASGAARIVVGARSAVFAPLHGLGLIVVDEEHDASYKQDSDPRYDARTVAAKRAALEGAVAVYGSATPRPESWAGLERLALGGRLGAALPDLVPIRLDADTAAVPGALAEALARFDQTDRAVLVGTQMVAKGHHFSGVALAAVVDADTGLGLPDFRAEERTFQLLTQLAGRSGRDAPGLVLVQTFQPDALPFLFAQRHDVAGFLAEELERRTALGYPPLSHLVTIVASGPEADGVAQVLREVRAGLEGAVEGAILGPAPLLRLRGRHRAQLVAKTREPRALARRAAALLAAASPGLRRRGLTAVVDVDAQSL